MLTLMSALRQEQRLRQQEVADRVGFSISKLSRIENGYDKKITDEELKKIAKVLNWTGQPSKLLEEVKLPLQAARRQ